MDTVDEIRMSEKAIERQILVQCSGDGIRLWKNEVGVGYQGNVSRKGSSVLINNARVTRYGLAKGSPDLIGFKRIEITSDMVGKHVAVFVGIEVKDAKGKPSEEQKLFMNMLREHGAITGIARSVDQAECILEESI